MDRGTLGMFVLYVRLLVKGFTTRWLNNVELVRGACDAHSM
jgi:hypothetical protein